MMENHFTHKVSRFFPSSFSSCRFKSVTDVVESSIFTAQKPHENQSSRNQFPKVNLDQHRKDLDNVSKDDKKATMLLGYVSPSINGRRCRPVTPVSVVDSHLNPESTVSTTSSSNTGETHRESNTLFSFSSATSSESSRPKKDETGKKNGELNEEEFDYYSDYSSCRRKTSKPHWKTKKSRRRGGTGWCAIEKSTNDPYGEFRKSMVEMIVENQIFGAEDLNRLLHCFLSLNSPYFHEVIVEVYLEIIGTLFSN